MGRGVSRVGKRSLKSGRAHKVLISFGVVFVGYSAAGCSGLYSWGSEEVPSAEGPAVEVPADSAAAELADFVDEAVAFIEGVRGRTFKQLPVVRLVEEAEFVELILEDTRAYVAEDPESAESTTVFNRSLGLFSPDQEIEEVDNLFVQGGVIGVYFPSTDQLLVRASPALTLLTKSTIVHELIHAFDDQWFDLDRQDSFDDTTEHSWTFGAAAEGSASYIQRLWEAELSEDQRAAMSTEGLDTGDTDLLFELDLAYLFLQFSVYEYGEPWIAALVDQGGIAALDAVLTDPVATSEEVMAATWPAELAVIDVAAPQVDGEIVWQGVGGQVVLESMFAATNAGPYAAAEGWGGDAMTLYRGATGQSCVRWDIAMDTAVDSEQLRVALENWVDLQGGEVTVLGELVRLDRCS